MIHPIQGFKELPAKKKAAVIASGAVVVGGAALTTVAALHGKKILDAGEVQNTVQKTGLLKKIGTGYSDWYSKVSNSVSDLFNKFRRTKTESMEFEYVGSLYTSAEKAEPSVIEKVQEPIMMHE